MSSHETSPRRSWRTHTQGMRVIRLLVSGTQRPAASDAGSTQSREALLQACARGDRTALHSLYAGTASQLFGLALRMLRSRELAEEVMQDAFVLVWRNAHTFDPGRGTAMAWLARIVRNRCIDILRRRGRETPLDETSVANWEDPASRPADLVALSLDARRMRDCLNELEESPRKALELVYYDGMTHEEVAAHLGVPLGTAKS